MKKIVSLLVLGVVFLTSCTSEDEAGIEETALLKSYEIKKDINGRFTIDYKVNETVVSDFVKNYENGYNEIYLYEGSKVSEEGSKFISSKIIDLNNNELKVGVYENNAKKKSIIIKDGNIALSKNDEGVFEASPFLDSYSISDLGGDEYELSFTTKDGVSVDFSYNNEKDIYEIHLKPNSNYTSSNFKKNYHKSNQNNSLQIDFVNFIVNDNLSSKESNDLISYVTKGKPIIIIQ